MLPVPFFLVICSGLDLIYHVLGVFLSTPIFCGKARNIHNCFLCYKILGSSIGHVNIFKIKIFCKRYRLHDALLHDRLKPIFVFGFS